MGDGEEREREKERRRCWVNATQITGGRGYKQEVTSEHVGPAQFILWLLSTTDGEIIPVLLKIQHVLRRILDNHCFQTYL